MDTMVKLAFEQLSGEIEKLKQIIESQKRRIDQLDRLKNDQQTNVLPEPKHADELLTNQQVKQILKIGKNSLIKLVRDGVLVAIRFNDRTVRFSKMAIMQYIERKQLQN